MNSNFALSECPLFIISVFLFNCMIFYYTAYLVNERINYIYMLSNQLKFKNYYKKLKFR
ncbi:hypothetical protein CNEO4_290072 [Clostridium neonatale]|nr:hypothetical protein CNEO_310056 [Clostridium neonatale]CAI3535047.1 hypothetical protein CNEO3_100057 [Clostridium neonatale]CAI3578452.1 hypothetical protein CNEO4_160058 [Clostridium neonatale]CAI3605491.1 hypothetical protein CNEO4_290072 [Clostridium neonatale]